MLDAKPAKLTKFGSVTIDANDSFIRIEGFEGEGCSCRDVSALAMLWAIGELQRELMKTLESPEGGSCSIN